METPMEIFKSEDGKVQVNVRKEGELQEKATTEIFSVVRNEGGRQVSRQLRHYNLDAIIAVGYRVNSARATACAKRNVARALRNLNVICGTWKMTTMINRKVNDGNKNHEG